MRRTITMNQRRYFCDGSSERADNDDVVVMLGENLGFGTACNGGRDLAETVCSRGHCRGMESKRRVLRSVVSKRPVGVFRSRSHVII